MSGGGGVDVGGDGRRAMRRPALAARPPASAPGFGRSRRRGEARRGRQGSHQPPLWPSARGRHGRSGGRASIHSPAHRPEERSRVGRLSARPDRRTYPILPGINSYSIDTIDTLALSTDTRAIPRADPTCDTSELYKI
jgi:hypothetical protein